MPDCSSTSLLILRAADRSPQTRSGNQRKPSQPRTLANWVHARDVLIVSVTRRSIAGIDAACRSVQQKMMSARLTEWLGKALNWRASAIVGAQSVRIEWE
jgi:hypothetical protein